VALVTDRSYVSRNQVIVRTAITSLRQKALSGVLIAKLKDGDLIRLEAIERDFVGSISEMRENCLTA